MRTPYEVNTKTHHMYVVLHICARRTHFTLHVYHCMACCSVYAVPLIVVVLLLPLLLWGVQVLRHDTQLCVLLATGQDVRGVAAPVLLAHQT